jgi:nucleotide-binding universal stress UspA family protein
MSQDPGSRRQRIVAASDLSEDSDRCLQAAASLARRMAADLYVFHCVSQPVFPFWEGLVSGESREQWLQSARVDLEWQVRRVMGEEGTDFPLQIAIGEPAREVADYARGVSADLLVLGPHEPRAAFDDLLGTTADRLIRTATVPCLVANRPISPPLRRVLLPVDFSAPSNHAVQVAMDLLGGAVFAGADDEAPTVVEVLFVSAFAASYPRPLAVEPRLSEQVRAAATRLPEHSRVKLLPRILSAPMPIDGIRRAAERMDAELIVLGTHGYGTLGRALIGSVASAVARTLPFPVLLVPPPA